MKNSSIFYLAIIFAGLLAISCNNNTSKDTNKSNASEFDSAVENNSVSVKKELDSAFKKMWQNVTLTNFANYINTDVSDDFFTINADGIVQNKEELLADTARLKMLEVLTFKFFDKQIKVYDNVGIINGRIRAFTEGKYVAEIFYTAVFVKKNGTWMYKNWQGTWTKDSPPPPSFMPEIKK